jgi:hypothetical protein
MVPAQLVVAEPEDGRVDGHAAQADQPEGQESPRLGDPSGPRRRTIPQLPDHAGPAQPGQVPQESEALPRGSLRTVGMAWCEAVSNFGDLCHRITDQDLQQDLEADRVQAVEVHRCPLEREQPAERIAHHDQPPWE